MSKSSCTCILSLLRLYPFREENNHLECVDKKIIFMEKHGPGVNYLSYLMISSGDKMTVEGGDWIVYSKDT